MFIIPNDQKRGLSYLIKVCIDLPNSYFAISTCIVKYANQLLYCENQLPFYTGGKESVRTTKRGPPSVFARTGPGFLWVPVHPMDFFDIVLIFEKNIDFS